MKYRKSDYCIDVKLEKAKDKYMLVHSYTGAIDIVSRGLIEYLKCNKEFDTNDFPFSEATFDTLKRRGHITQKTTAEEREHVRRLATLLHDDAKNSPASFLFMVSYDCNFRCPYCYEAGISKGGSMWSKKRFTKEMVDRAYVAMAELAPDEKKRSKRITLYGGEPFLKENVDIVEYIVERGSALGYNFDAVTNGHDLEHYKHILAMPSIKNLQITLDGAGEIHNSRRYHHETGDSFDTIFKNIGLALDNDVSVNVRFNVDANNFAEIKKLKKMFDEVGYSEQKHFHFYTAMLDGLWVNEAQREKGEIDDTNITYLSLEDYSKMHKKEGLEINHNDYKLYKKLISAINNGTYLRLNSILCGTQANMYIFDPYGSLYSCWGVVGVNQHSWGDYSNGIMFSEARKRWRDRNIGNMPQCSVCKYGLLCGGGCSAKALRNMGDLEKSFCDNFSNKFKRSVNMVFDDWQNNQIKSEDKQIKN